MTELTNRIGYWRKQRGYTQDELANALGLSRQAVSNAETGRYILSLAHAFKAARTLKVSVEDLYQETTRT